MNLTSLDICSGAGGLAAGLAQAKFQTKMVCDFDSDSCATLESNMSLFTENAKEFEVTNRDIRKVDFKRFSETIDLVSGGPPCQPFSRGGKHSAQRDKRDLFPEAIRAVRETRPNAYLFENVCGLQRPSFNHYFEYIRLQLTHPEIEIRSDEKWQDHLRRLENHHISGSRKGLNYRLVVHNLNAADYGVPQRRNRVFFVGFKEDLDVDWCFPKPTHSRHALAAAMEAGTYWERHRIPSQLRSPPRSIGLPQNTLVFEDSLPWITLRDAIFDLPTPIDSPASSDALHVFRGGAKAYKGHTGSRLDEPAKTLKAGVHGVPGGENMFTDDDGLLRYFTLRECSRIQTFPDKFEFIGAWSSVLKQMGNAVPVHLSATIGTSIANALLQAGHEVN